MMPAVRFGLAILIALVGSAWAQDSPHPVIPLTNEVIGPQLIAWSELQKPVPELIVRGVVKREDNVYILQSARGGSLPLDESVNAQAFEGQRVQVSGRCDVQNVLHVITIEPLP
jgi:hypothetical protein